MSVNPPASTVGTDPVSIVVRSIHAMASGDRDVFDALYHPDAVDRENRIQPPSSRVHGADCFYSTARWLRAAFADLRYDIHHAFADGDLVAVNSTMNGRHVAPWVVYDAQAEVDTVFPPTGKTFAATQSHWFRMKDGRIVEHWANRDDVGMSHQLGWVPYPQPGIPTQNGPSQATGSTRTPPPGIGPIYSVSPSAQPA
jgi:predicted ester cyclase